MKLFVMTDLEGVAGIINGQDYLYPTGRYYEKAKRLLTEEVNAAIDGFAAGGFDEFLVCDGHGAGAIDQELLDERALLQRGWERGVYPFGLDASFDAMAYVGQHAKAGTPFSHLTHTGWWTIRDEQINGLSIGEYGEGALVAGELGVPLIFAAGEEAFCREAQTLTPWVVTASVLRGVIGGSGDELSSEDYERFHEGAVHLHPRRACALIRRQAELAARRFVENRQSFLPFRPLQPPYRLQIFRRSKNNAPLKPSDVSGDSIIDVLKRKNG